MNPGFRGVCFVLGGLTIGLVAGQPAVFGWPVIAAAGCLVLLFAVLAWQRRVRWALWAAIRLLAYIECAERRPRAVARWDERVTDGMASAELAEATWSGRADGR